MASNLPTFEEVMKKEKKDGLPKFEEVVKGPSEERRRDYTESRGSGKYQIEPDSLPTTDTDKSASRSFAAAFDQSYQRTPDRKIEGEPGRGDYLLAGLMTGLTFGAGSDQLRKEAPEYSGTTTVGEILGSIAPITGAYKTGGRLVSRGLNKISPDAPKWLQRLAQGTGAGVTFGTAGEAIESLSTDEPLTERAKDVAIEGALFGGVDAATYGLGRGIKKVADATGLTPRVMKLFERFRPKQPTPQLQEPPKALPAPQRRVRPKYESPKPTEQTEILALPPGRTPTMDRFNFRQETGLGGRRFKLADQEYTLNKVMEEIKPEVMEAITPPYESERQLKKWIKQHMGGIPNKELDQLSYAEAQNLAELIRREFKIADVARQVAARKGYNLDELLEGQYDPLQTLMRQRLQQRAGATSFTPRRRYPSVPPRPTEQTGEPLQFRRERYVPMVEEGPEQFAGQAIGPRQRYVSQGGTPGPRVSKDSLSDIQTVRDVVKQNLKDVEQTVKSQQQRTGIVSGSQAFESGIKRSKVKSPDPDIERATTATKKAADNVMGWAKEKLNKIADGFKKYFSYRDDIKHLPKLRNELRKMEDAGADANRFAKESLEGIIGGLRDRQEYDVFRKMVVVRDLIETGNRGEKLPQGVTVEKLQQELQRLNSIATPEVKKAVEKHDRLMRAIAEDLVQRGKLSPESIREHYYTHRVLNYSNSLDSLIPNIPKELKTPNRYYTKQRMGSINDIDTNYTEVMHKLLAKIQLDNQLDDFVEKTVKEFDVLPKLKEEPKISRDGSRVTLDDGKQYVFWHYNGKTYLLEEPVYNNLKDFKQSVQTTPGQSFIRNMTSWWKRITLTASGLRFHVNNFTGDLEALYREDPAAITKIPSAIRALTRFRTPEQSKLIDEAFRQRILQSGINEAMIGSIFSNPRLTKFEPKYKKFFYWMNPFNLNEAISSNRDAIVRLAKFFKDVERIQQGKNVVTKTVDTTGLEGIDAAGKVAREVFIDYGKVTKAFENDLRGILFPFITFYAQNFKNWAKYIAKHPAEASAKLGIPFGAMMLWNYSGERREIEENLPEYYRNTPHIVTGYTNENGDPYVVVFEMPSNLAGAVLGLNTLPANIADMASGRQTPEEMLSQQARDVAQGPGKSALDLLNPLIKAPIEAYAANKSYFTGAPIVPQRLEGTPEDPKLRLQYLLGQLATPYGQFQRAERQNEPGNNVLNALLGQTLNVPRGLGIRDVNLEATERARQYEAADKARDWYNTNKARLEEAYIDYVVNENTEPLQELAQEFPITNDDLKRLRESPRVQIAITEEILKQTTDPEERRRLEQHINQLRQLQLQETLKRLPKKSRGKFQEYIE